MENERVFIAIDKQSFRDVLNEVFNHDSEVKIPPEFKDDRLTKTEAAELANISMPTLDKLTKSGRFKMYNVGHRKYFLRSEMLEALRKNG